MNPSGQAAATATMACTKAVSAYLVARLQTRKVNTTTWVDATDPSRPKETAARAFIGSSVSNWTLSTGYWPNIRGNEFRALGTLQIGSTTATVSTRAFRI